MNSTSIIAVAVAIIAVAGIGAVFLMNGDSDDKRDTITVTMSWQKDIVEDIVGDRYMVASMMGSNVSPHEDYSTPSNISDLYKSKLYFKIGSGVEWETAFFDAVQKDIPSSVTVVDIAKSIEYTPLPNTHHHHHDDEEHDHEEEHEKSAYDPHIWTSPEILRDIASLIAKKISELDPTNASEYAKNLKAYDERIDAVDAKMREIAAIVGDEHTHVMVWHPAWQYLLEQYAEGFGADFHQESVEEDGEVSPAEAARIVIEEGCDSIFVSTTDEGYEGRKALEEAGITVHVVNPTADDMIKAVAEFLDFLKSDLQSA